MRHPLLILALTIASHCHAGEAKIRLKESTINVALATTESEHRQGLMGKTELKNNQGMLFVYDQPQQISFWMKEMLIPLDILFFDSDGKLLEIIADTPPCQKSPCATYTNNTPALYVLEVPAGTAKRLKLQPGDTFSIHHQ